MKYRLFIDNFRGFSNTIIPITDVNFLVGENSTGKTSVLGLMKLQSGANLFLSTRSGFSAPPLNFGNFSDMVSAHSSDQSSFRIGAMWIPPTRKNEEKMPTGYLLTFIDDEGVPTLSRYTFCGAGRVMSLALHKNGDIHYRIEKISAPLTLDTISKNLLPKWIDEHSRQISPRFSKLKLPLDVPKSVPPIFIIMSMVSEVSGESLRARKKGPPREGDFPDPTGIFTPDMTWIAPIRTKPKRTYDEVRLEFSPEGEHTPYIIRRMLKSKPVASRFTAFIKRIGRESGLFQDVKVKEYGKTRFELDIVLDGKALNISNVGYGVSQSLPVLAEIVARGHGSWFAIQQPEVHLHPRAQASLGDLFFEMAALDHKMFLVETHSDFTIDRFRMNYKRKKTSVRPDSQILFFQRQDRHNVVTPLPISQAGELPAAQPEGYRDFFIREELSLLRL